MSATARRDSPNSSLSERPRIVIADDHEPTRVLLRTLIELEAMHVVGEAEDGKTAIALAVEHQPDIVLLDVNMPGLDGISAAEIIRIQHPQIHILLHTGEPLETTRDRAAELNLPLFDKRDLHNTIAQLGRRQASLNAASPSSTTQSGPEHTTVTVSRPARKFLC